METINTNKNMNINLIKYLLFFQKINHVGFKTIFSLIDFFGSLENAFNASVCDYTKFGFNDFVINQIIKEKSVFNFDTEIEKYNKLDINIVSFFDDDYPVLLKQISQPPILLFYKGNINNINKTIGVVGSRKCTEYGVSVTKDFCKYFAQNNIITISGGAIGIDSVCHNSSINNNYRTIAVMGCGLDQLYPYFNKQLFQDILNNNGAIVSEFPIGVKPIGKNFIMRNRIIAGLSYGLLVVEAGVKSGTMTTVSFANEQNKNIFVIPGSIYSEFSIGTNNLIKDGAIFVTEPKEICEMVWGIDENQKLKTKNQKEIEIKNIIDTSWMSDDEKNVFNIISFKSICIEEIFEITKININKLNSILILFEIKGLIKSVDGMKYVRI